MILDSPVWLEAIEADGLDAIAAMPRVLREICAAGPCAETVKDAAGGAARGGPARAPARGARPARVGRGGRRATVETSASARRASTTRSSSPPPRPGPGGPARGAAVARARGCGAASSISASLDVDRRARTIAPDEIESPFSMSRYHATMCLEARLPWAHGLGGQTSRRRRSSLASTRSGRGRSRPSAPTRCVRIGATSELCKSWPATPAPEPPPAIAPDVPVLILSGREDLITPLEQARAGRGHVPARDPARAPARRATPCSATPRARGRRWRRSWPAVCRGPCARDAPPCTAAAVRARDAARPDGDRAGHARRRAPPPRASRALSGAHRRYELWGLRGGYTLVERGRFDLRAVEWVRRVRVSGRLSAAGNGRLTLSGAVRGTVVVRGFRARP